jgi:hypothetical protein
MRSPNYRLALALAQAGWNSNETARRINARAVERGYLGVAVDRSRVSRWIRRGERPRFPVPGLLAELLTEQTGQPYTPNLLGIGPARSVVVTLDEREHQALTQRAAAANMPLEHYAQTLISRCLSGEEVTLGASVPSTRRPCVDGRPHSDATPTGGP